MATSKPVHVSPAQAQDHLSPALRNNIYSALLSSNGIRNMEGTLEHEMQASGWTANLKAYITHLLRSGECTTVAEIKTRVHEKILQDKLGLDGEPEKSNGVTNGVGRVNGHKEADAYDLTIPENAIREGVKVVRMELEKVCEITVPGDSR
ncbi:hypothetical protein BDV95DRAFT_592992 [Massariosphaeria phaeospora]|uniref:Uncharacterized protein n=1 Tax=Massariosphaeria phaeospora TaxID=100035 RepID=A0A7C8IAY4_9PLEO|nr:hypothetical protein BDV95DRAFT_592992 [Massariosphaeria phaeospora]